VGQWEQGREGAHRGLITTRGDAEFGVSLLISGESDRFPTMGDGNTVRVADGQEFGSLRRLPQIGAGTKGLACSRGSYVVNGEPVIAQAGDLESRPAERPIATAVDQSPRMVYEARIEIRGHEQDAAMAAVKFRAFLRRYFKPPGLTIRIVDELNHPERRASS